METVLLQAADGAQATIYLDGAHVTSWRTPDGAEQLYLSEHSEFRPGKAIRGGVPIIFPQFNQLGPLPRHGFARTSEWEFVGTDADGNVAKAMFRLTDSDATRALWDYSFEAEYHVTVGGNTLSLELHILNTSPAPFSCTGALHTYFRVADIATVHIYGLASTSFRDQAHGGEPMKQTAEPLVVTAETDRLYEHAPKVLELRDAARSLHIEKMGFPDVVVWNPFDKGKTIADLTPGGERHFVCIEAAAVSQPIVLDSQAHWRGAQIVKVERTP